MSDMDKIDYDHLVEDALRAVPKKVLKKAEKSGLPGEHYFYITFKTQHPDVVLPDHLRATHPEEMTIVIQYQFRDLEVDKRCFSVTLSFNNIEQRLTVPFESIISFADPHAKFGLQFTAPNVDALSTASDLPSSIDEDEDNEPAEENNVVALDAFRKK